MIQANKGFIARQSMGKHKQLLIAGIPVTINPLSFPAWAAARSTLTLAAGVFKVLQRSSQGIWVYWFRAGPGARSGRSSCAVCRLGLDPMAWGRRVGRWRGDGLPVHAGIEGICFGHASSRCASAA